MADAGVTGGGGQRKRMISPPGVSDGMPAGMAFGALVLLLLVGLVVVYNVVSLPDEPELAQTSVVLGADGE